MAWAIAEWLKLGVVLTILGVLIYIDRRKL